MELYLAENYLYNSMRVMEACVPAMWSHPNYLEPVTKGQNFTSFIRTSSTSRCGGFTKNFPPLTVSNYSSYSIPLNSSFLQNLLFAFFPQVCWGLPLGLFPHVLARQAILGYLLSPILTTCHRHLKCVISIISLRELLLVPLLLFHS
jgi:hypothetical protein